MRKFPHLSSQRYTRIVLADPHHHAPGRPDVSRGACRSKRSERSVFYVRKELSGSL